MRSDRPLTLPRGAAAPSEPSSGACSCPRARSSLFDGVALSLIPVFLVRTLGVDNYALVGAAGSWCWSRGAQPDRPPRLRPDRAIGWGLAAASVVSLGVVASAPAESVGLALAAGGDRAAAGLVFKGGLDLCTQIAPSRTAAS